MAFCISTNDIQRACVPNAATLGSAWRWTRGLPRRRVQGGNRRGSSAAYFRFSDIIPAFRRLRRSGLCDAPLRRLLDVVPDDNPADVLDDADARATGLLDTLTDEERGRFDRVRKWAADGAGYSLWQKIHLVRLSRSLGLLILRPTVADYVFTARRREGFPTTLEQWGDYMADHVIATASPDEIKQLAD